ncbi:hypothetical protein [Gaoshiqia sp. Z1-71]|uniref:hypothetical protein n=1 Tax=Gaoshiqia hydrogeniformans TaxID=3290090 RepID=UPI003BF873BF
MKNQDKGQSVMIMILMETNFPSDPTKIRRFSIGLSISHLCEYSEIRAFPVFFGKSSLLFDQPKNPFEKPKPKTGRFDGLA